MAESPNKWYNSVQGQSQISGAERDHFGNAQGQRYDLARPNAFAGKRIAVPQLCSFDFGLPQAALSEKGTEVVHWSAVPRLDSFDQELATCTQLRIIAGDRGQLGAEHQASVCRFFESGRGLISGPITTHLRRM